ncbi:DUF3086 domain-containing protein [Pseudanabaenaceae cyanobacterium LEGE 13415]|nr:DUF3086 domain-containing protein [Pseudanabaenaceae cyanobacterium LEGE 13415]
MSSDELPISDETKPSETGAALPELKLPETQSDLTQQEQALQREIEMLIATRDDLQAQIAQTQDALGRVVQQNLAELEQRRQTLQLSIEQLERRQERIRNEMKSSFAGASQEIAVRVQSFKDYLVGSLQDLAIAAEQLELPTFQAAPSQPVPVQEESKPQAVPSPNFAESTFEEQSKKIRSIIDQFRNQPDYYGPVWKLRRTFEPVHAERVSTWFFKQGGRGAIRTMGSRLQNILIASAATSILYNLYRDRLRVLILANSPERLGEWRRGLQDCLGVTRSDFGSDRGIALFEVPEPLALKAERLDKDGFLPLIIVDETEENINLALLQFPLLLAFAPSPQQMIQQQSYY